MKCDKCGAENNAGAIFCSSCGALLKYSAKTESVPDEHGCYEKSIIVDDNIDNINKKNRKGILFPIGLVAVVVFLIVIINFPWKSNKSNQTQHNEETKEITNNNDNMANYNSLNNNDTTNSINNIDISEFVIDEGDDGNLIIVEYKGDESIVDIMPDINGVPITQIGETAFQANNCIEEVSIPQSVKRIGAFAFERCGNLQTISLNDGLEVIEENAFANCSMLESISFPSSLIEVDGFAFDHCSRLEKADLNEGLKYIGEYAFIDTKIKDITIPETVEIIETHAFDNVPLNTVSFISGEYPLSIGYNAFEEYKSDSIILPGNVTYIDLNAFYWVKEITLERCTISGSEQTIVLSYGKPLEKFHGTETITEIDGTANEETIFYGPADSKIERFAKMSDCKFIEE